MFATKLQGASLFLLICRDLQGSDAFRKRGPERATHRCVPVSVPDGAEESSNCGPGGGIIPLRPSLGRHGGRCPRTRLSRETQWFEQGAPMSSIAIAQPASPKPAASPYAELKRRVEAAGLMRKRPGYYSLMLVTNTLLFATCFAVLALTKNVWWTILAAAVLGFVSGQLGFQLHDSGHRQMFSSRRLNTIVGIVTGDGLLGMSHGWWVDKHNKHHGNPNHQDLDPDIGVGVTADRAWRTDGLPPLAGPHRTQRARPPQNRLTLWMPELPDRAPSLPDHASLQHPRGAQNRARVLRRSGCSVPRNVDLPVLPRDPRVPA